VIHLCPFACQLLNERAAFFFVAKVNIKDQLTVDQNNKETFVCSKKYF